MARTTKSKRIAATSSAAALAAVMFAATGQAAPFQQAKRIPGPERAERAERESLDIKHAGKTTALNYSKIRTEYKHKGEYSVVGQNRGQIIFQDVRGNLFYIDQTTGDQKFVSSDFYIKYINRSNTDVLSKGSERVTIVGVDGDGKVIMKNTRGKNFYLDPNTGDIIDIILTNILISG